MTDSRCMFVALVGQPNVGKSTLLNRVVGSKISIVTPKVQTTRTRVVGIFVRNEVQIIFVDTPGIFEPKQRLQRAMVDAAWSSARDADCVVLLIDVNAGLNDHTYPLIATLRKRKISVIAALNKIDLTKPSHLLRLTADLDKESLFTDIFKSSYTLFKLIISSFSTLDFTT